MSDETPTNQEASPETSPPAPPEEQIEAPAEGGADPNPNLDVIRDIPVRISLEVGNTRISIRELLQLRRGSVVELDRGTGEPLDVLVNGKLVARGEVVVVKDKFGIRLTEVLSTEQRIETLH